MKNSSRLIVLLLAGSLGLPCTVGAVETAEEIIVGRVYTAMFVVKAVVAAILVGKWIKDKVAVARITKELKQQLPDYPEAVLKLAAIAKEKGLDNLIRTIAVENVVRFRRPKQAIRLLAEDPQIVNAVAFAINKQPEYVRNAFLNPTTRLIMSPF